MSDGLRSVAHIWRARVAKTPASLAFQHRMDGVWTPMTWRQADERVRRIAGGLLALGVAPGDRVGILCTTRVEWVLIDFAILCAGAAVTTIYPSSTADACAYILEDSGSAAVFVEDAAQLAKLKSGTRHVIVVDPEGAPPGDWIALADLEERGALCLEADPRALDERLDQIGPEDLATLIYTSGTTGPPKGVRLVHDNWVFQAETLEHDLGEQLGPGDKQYLFLPLAHSFGKICELIAVHVGAPTAIEGDIDALVDGLQATQPTFVAAVPRVFEKIHHRIVARAQAAGPRPYAVFRWAEAVGIRVAERRLSGRRVGVRLRAQVVVADRLVFRRLRAALGGRIRAFVSGGAPLSPDLARFFYGAGMTVCEGYGLTESSAGAVANRLDDLGFGTVGKPFPGTELRIAASGEVQLRGRHVMRGYHNLPEATSAALDADGWLHTGDLGELDGDGRLRITGRIKELIITAGGKNIGPQRIENLVKSASPLVSEVVLHGDRRPYCVAIVWLDDPAGVEDPAVRRSIEAAVARVNERLPSFETIKQVHIAPGDIADSDLITPSMKIKRTLVEARFSQILDGMYAGSTARA